MRNVRTLAASLVLALVLVILLLEGGQFAASAQSPDAADIPAGYLPVTVDPAIARDNMILFWDNVALDAIRAEPPGPPMVARVMAMVHTAQYEAWAQYDATAVGTLLGDRFRRPLAERTLENKSIAASYAAYRVLVDLFPRRTRTFDSKMKDVLKYDPAVVTTDPSTPEGIGNLAGAAVLLHWRYDGSNQLGGYADTTGYQPVNTPDSVVDLNRWQPLRTANGNQQGVCLSGSLITQTYIGPHWGLVEPFALDDGPEITATTGPILYPSPEFTAQAQEVISYSAGGFGFDQQLALAAAAREAARRGVPVLISNHTTAEIEAAYAGATIQRFQVQRFISADGENRGTASELLALFLP